MSSSLQFTQSPSFFLNLLPNEVMHMILDYLSMKEKRTFLTSISRKRCFKRFLATYLYYDPFSLTYTSEQAYLLIRTLLTLSPATNNEVNTARGYMGIMPVYETPSEDSNARLSLNTVNNVALFSRSGPILHLISEIPIHITKNRHDFINALFLGVWHSVFGHRLTTVSKLLVPYDGIKFLHGVFDAHQLPQPNPFRNLRTLVLHMPQCALTDTSDISFPEERGDHLTGTAEFVQAFIARMGNESAPLDLRFSALTHDGRYPDNPQMLTAIRMIYELMPRLTVSSIMAPVAGDTSPLWLRFHTSPLSFDLQRVREIKQFLTWDDEILPWPSEGSFAILERCTSLKTLSIACSNTATLPMIWPSPLEVLNIRSRDSQSFSVGYIARSAGRTLKRLNIKARHISLESAAMSRFTTLTNLALRALDFRVSFTEGEARVHFNVLQHLELHDAATLLMLRLGQLNSLRTLQLQSSRRYPQFSWNHLSNYPLFPNLEALVIGGHGTTDFNVKKLHVVCPTLRHLTVESPLIMDLAKTDVICSVTSLHLKNWDYKGHRRLQLEILLDGLQNVRMVSMSGCSFDDLTLNYFHGEKYRHIRWL